MTGLTNGIEPPFTIRLERGGENMNRNTLTIVICIALGALLYVLLF
jgi:hypothetical protein